MQVIPTDWINLLPALAVGTAIGLFFFGGLRLTVQMLPRASRPWLWAALSFTVRSAAAVAGFYWIAGERWLAWVACLLGFLLSRTVVVGFEKLKTLKFI
jgi:F1F0 ATPase subunit 2